MIRTATAGGGGSRDWLRSSASPSPASSTTSLLRGLNDFSGIDYVGDKLLHVVVPVLAVAGWAVWGPRPRVGGREIGLAICWPLAFLAWSLVMGWLSGWYPYPFLDHREQGGSLGVALTALGITAFFVVLFALAQLVDRRGPPAPRVTGGPGPVRGGTMAP